MIKSVGITTMCIPESTWGTLEPYPVYSISAMWTEYWMPKGPSASRSSWVHPPMPSPFGWQGLPDHHVRGVEL